MVFISQYISGHYIVHLKHKMLHLNQLHLNRVGKKGLFCSLEKAQESEIKLPTLAGSLKKQESSRKTSISALLTMFNSGDHNKLWKIFKETGIPHHLIFLLRNLYAGQEATVRTGHGTTDWFQRGKEYVKAVYCNPASLTYIQSTS